ncbi:MFS transporter [Mesorhizobium sp. CAU 1741]|uniref:MFS transporter n=1 Tax=Mesorhizobium sp. CAU 1741 TaxID=3140366 RepID=UPI00325C06F1
MTPLPPLSAEQSVKPGHFELRMSLLFAAIFIPAGIHLPYFPLWLEAAGFGPAEIGVILSAPMFLRVLTTPFVTALADKARDRVDVLLVTVVVSLVACIGYFLTSSYALILVVSLVLAVFWTPQVPLVDSLAMSGVRRYAMDYSRVRIWGSASFLMTSLVGGMVLGATGIGAVPAFMMGGLGATLAAALLAPRLGRPRLASPLSAAGFQDASPALLNRRFLYFLCGAGLITASHGFVYGFSSIYWASLGIGEGTVGLLWGWGVAAEVAVFMVFTRLFGRMSPSHLLVIAGGAAVIRWGAFPLIWPSGLGVPGYFLVQTLHAASTGLVLLGVQKMIAETVADHRFGAAQGIAFFANGVTMAAVTLASGPLYEHFGAGGFFVMAGVAMLGTVLIVVGARRHPHRAGAGGDTNDPS